MEIELAKNITLSVDDDVLEQVKVLAAERKTSVNGLVREFLTPIVAKERAKDEAREALLRLAREKNDMGDETWKREDLYER